MAVDIGRLTLNDFIFAAARDNDKALALSQNGGLTDVKVRNNLTGADLRDAQNLRCQFAGVLSEAYRSAGVAEEKIDAICTSLGIGRIDDEGVKTFMKPLTSREVKSVLMAAQQKLGNAADSRVYDEIADLRKCGLYDEKHARSALETVMTGPLATADGMAKALKAILGAKSGISFPGLTAKNAETFVKANFAQLKQLAFDYAYRSAYAEGKTVGPAVALATAALRLMNAYGSRGEGLKPGVMPLTWSLKLVMGEQPPVIEKTPQLAAKCPLPASMKDMLDGLRSYSKGNSPTARRLGIIADRLEAEWFRMASLQNGEDLAGATLAAFRSELKGTLGDEGLDFLFKNCDWREIGICGDSLLKELDSKIVVNLSKNGVDAKPTLGDVLKALLNSARKTMKQGDVRSLARALAEKAILEACQNGDTNLADLEKTGKTAEIYDLAEKLVRPTQDDGKDCPDEIKPLFTAELNGSTLSVDGLEKTSDARLKEAFQILKGKIDKLVQDTMAQVRNRDKAFSEVGKKLNLSFKGVVNTDLLEGEDAEAIHCKLVLLKLYLPKDQLAKDIDLDRAIDKMSFVGSPEEKAEWAQRVLKKVNDRVNAIPDDWLQPVMNALKSGIYFDGSHDPMFPAVLDGIGKTKVSPLASAILSRFSEERFSQLVTSVLSLAPRVAFERTRDFFQAFCEGMGALEEGQEITIKTCKGDPRWEFAIGDFECNRHIDFIFDTVPKLSSVEDAPLPDGIKNLGPKEILNLAKSFGISPEDLGTDVGIAKLLLIRLLLQAKNGSAEELAEWSQRMFGLDFRTIQPEDISAAVKKVCAYINPESDVRPEDPLVKLAKGNAPIDFLSGRRKFEESGLSDKEIGGLISVLSTIKKGGGPQTCVLGGIEYSVANAPDGTSTVFTMTGKAKGSQPLQVRFPQSPADFLTFLQMQIASNKDTAPEILRPLVENLGDVRQSEMPVARARELLVRILSARTGQPSVAFSSLSQQELHALTMATLRGEKVKIPEATGYYSDEAKVQLSAWDAASKADTSKVNMLSTHVDKTAEERTQTATSPQSVRALFGELFMNADVSLFDAEERTGANKGERMLALVKANRIELEALVAALDDAKAANTVPECLSALPPPLREGAARLISGQLRDLLGKLDGPDKAAVQQLCLEAERTVDTLADEVMKDLQDKVGTLFPDRPDDFGKHTDWKVPLKADGVGGIDVGSPEGQIVSTVLKHYFTRCDRLEKRAMMASFARNAIADAGAELSAGQQVAAALKGAGPVLQKMMQGLPLESFGPETQKAIKDMKCNLLPIPDSVIRAQLLDLVRNSNGNILSVQVMKPIGSATVAQALLCHIKTKDAPYTGKDVVIKLQRPNSQLAALREQKVVADILKDFAPQDRRESLGETFRQQFEGILKEFDFTVEAENIDVGHDNYNMVDENHKSVHSMDRFRDVMPNTGVLVLEKIDGETLESSVDKLAKPFVHEGVERKSYAVSEDGPVTEVLEAKDVQTLVDARQQIKATHEKLLLQRDSMVKLIDLWFSKGLLTDGFFHADLHAGNMMTNMKEDATGKLSSDVTFIDFGNVQRMTAAEQTNLVNLVLCCGQDVPDTGAAGFIDQLEKMVPNLKKTHSSANLAQLKATLGGIFRKGGSDMLFAKLSAAVSAAQSFGISLPPSVGAFLTSVMRLRNGLASIDAALAACEQEKAKLVLNQQLDQQLVAENKDDALNVSPRKSFEGVLLDVMMTHPDELRTKANFGLGKQFVYAGHLDTKNKELQKEAVKDVKAKHPNDDAKTVEAICAYVDSFMMPGGIYAKTFENANPQDVLNVFVTGLGTHLGRTLGDAEIAIAADMLKACRVAVLPKICLSLLQGYDPNGLNTKEHPLLAAFKALGKPDANRDGYEGDAVRIATEIAGRG